MLVHNHVLLLLLSNLPYVIHSTITAITARPDRPLKTLSAAINTQTGKEAPSSWLVGVSAVHPPSASGDHCMCHAAAVNVATSIDPLL